MVILNNTHPIQLNATLQEIYLLSLWIKNPKHTVSASGAKILIDANGNDLADYYGCSVEFDDGWSDEDTQEFLHWVRSLSQESSFGGVVENEYWITEEDVK